MDAVLKDDVAPNELLSPSTESFVLSVDQKDAIMQNFEWTPTDFGFKAGITYKLQADIAGNDFGSPQDVATTTNRTDAAISVGDFNDIALGLGLTPESEGQIELRVTSSIGSEFETIVSNIITVSVTSYATSFPPIWGMGAALKGWGPWPDNAVEWQSSEFKKYETVAYFTNGQTFRWFAQLGWDGTSYNYPFFTTVSPVFENANDGDSNLKVAGTSGWYKVNIDLIAKTVTAEQVDEPVLYMMGAALNGWGPWPSNAIKMTYVKPGVFVADAEFKTPDESFRFFGQADWSPTSYNYPFFTIVDANFDNANDNDKNFRFVGAPGVLKVTVDLNAKTVVVGDIPDPVLYMMGDALNGWGPWPSNAVVMEYADGKFTATATFTNGKAFRFFEQLDWNPTSYNYPYFTSVHADFENAADSDSNFKYVGATGSRTVTVDLVAKTVTLN
jgi:hypothetical protein